MVTTWLYPAGDGRPSGEENTGRSGLLVRLENLAV